MYEFRPKGQAAGTGAIKAIQRHYLAGGVSQKACSLRCQVLEGEKKYLYPTLGSYDQCSEKDCLFQNDLILFFYLFFY